MRHLRVLALALLASCHSHTHAGSTHEDAQKEDRPALSFTHWTDRTEIFVELPTLVRGLESPCAAHVTRLADFQPVDVGSVTMVLRGTGEESATSDKPPVPGIFRPVLRPSAAGRRHLFAIVEIGGGRDEHALGEIVVFESLEAAAQAARQAEPASRRIPFLKEQQWATPFSTEAAVEREVRATVRASGTVRARSEGDIVVSAPFAGRLATSGAPFPRVGGRATAEQTLASLTPKLESTDRASLDLAIASARLELQHSERERKRLEALQAEGAVPERRVLEATHAQEESRATLSAAERRLAQFARVQEARGPRGEGSVALRSPIAGVLVSVDAAPGAFVEAGTSIFRIVDTTQLWLEARVAAADAPRVADVRGAWFSVDGIAAPLEVGVDALAGRSPRIDPETRTLPVLFNLDNAAGLLAVGALARVHLIVGGESRAVTVPRSSVVDDSGQPVVFVQAEGEAFERRIVKLGGSDRDYVAVLSGISAGERVVSRGAWSVKLAASSGAIPAHGHSH